MTKIIYITSGKIGLHRFTYNELVELDYNNISFLLCLTQLRNGPWMPNKGWSIIVASKAKAMFMFLKMLLLNTSTCLKMTRKAKSEKVLSYFFIALSFYYDLRKEKAYTAIHCQMADNKLYIGYFLKKLLAIPLTTTVHAHELYQRRMYDSTEKTKKLFIECDKIFTISDFNASLLCKSLDLKPSRIVIMPLFPDIDYQNKVKNKAKILIVANWAEKKGYDVLLSAIKNLDRDDFVLWVVGGTYFSHNFINVDAKVKELNIQDKVAFLGRQGGVLLDIIFYACDIFCLPSYTEYYKDGKPAEREGIPVALMEAMAWGKPVISTRHAGIPELVEEFLVEEKNTVQLKEAIEFLLDNPGKWKEMGKKNKAIIEKKYSKENVNILANYFKQL